MKNYKKKLAGLVGILLTATMILSGCGSKENEDTLETPGVYAELPQAEGVKICPLGLAAAQRAVDDTV